MSAALCAVPKQRINRGRLMTLPAETQKRIVGLNRENTTLEIGISEAIPHGRLAVAVAFPARGWALAFAFFLCLCAILLCN